MAAHGTALVLGGTGIPRLQENAPPSRTVIGRFLMSEVPLYLLRHVGHGRDAMSRHIYRDRKCVCVRECLYESWRE